MCASTAGDGTEMQKEKRSTFQSSIATGTVRLLLRATVANHHRHPSSTLRKQGSLQFEEQIHHGVASQHLEG